MTLTFYTNPMSRGRIARWMLEETGCPYETVHVEFDAPRPDALRAANPLGKVPTIVHDGRVVTETAAICAYLADAFPEARLAPPPAERAAYYRWLFFAAASVEYAMLHRGLGIEMPAGRETTVGYGSQAALLDALEHAVSGAGFVAGEHFTAADLYVGAQIGWGMAFGTLERRPALSAYADRVSDRPAKRRADEMDDALMSGRA